MELGNLIYGNSRGEAQIPRTDRWEGVVFKLFEACEAFYGDGFEYGEGVDNELFALRAYYWGDCACGDDTEGHGPGCPTMQPNFHYKPDNFRVQWYKYPLRDAYMTPQIDVTEWGYIFEKCTAFVGGLSK